jgi:tRNA A64-2'-O-ribosylphosphate transferase
MSMEIVFSDTLTNLQELEAQGRNHIRKESLDTYNRLHSIAEDAEFVRQVFENYPGFALLR